MKLPVNLTWQQVVLVLGLVVAIIVAYERTPAAVGAVTAIVSTVTAGVLNLGSKQSKEDEEGGQP